MAIGPRPHRVDVVVLTAIPPEYAAVRGHLSYIIEDSHPDGDVYEIGRFHVPGDVLHVAIAEIGAGNPGAASATERMISHFHPEIACFVGVAGGIKDVALGDVVIGKKVYGYERGSENDDHFRPRPDVQCASHALVQRAQAESRKYGWKSRLAAIDPARVPGTVHLGAIAAGEKVVKSAATTVARFIRECYGDALAVEMEGIGFLTATHRFPDIKALLVRGVSDLLDNKAMSDREGWQVTAAVNASAFAFEVLAQWHLSRSTERVRVTATVSKRQLAELLRCVANMAGEEPVLLHVSGDQA